MEQVMFESIGGVEHDGLPYVRSALMALPKDCLFWINGMNPSVNAPRAHFLAGTVLIGVPDVVSDYRRESALGVRVPPTAETLDSLDDLRLEFPGSRPITVRLMDSAVFTYAGTMYVVPNSTVPSWDRCTSNKPFFCRAQGNPLHFRLFSHFVPNY